MTTEHMPKDKPYILYMHKNKVNNKRYIGITCQTPSQRWRNGLGYQSNQYFFRSINKYGWDGFDHIILKENLSLDEACQLEIEYIKKYNTTNPSLGYNLSLGGDIPPMTGKHHTKESNEKNRIAHLGKKVSEENKKATSIRSQKMWDNMSPEERKRRIDIFVNSPKPKKEVGNGAKEIICLETKQVFPSSHYASRRVCGDTGNASNIRACCRGKHKKIKGYSWMWYEDYLKQIKEENNG